MMRCFSYGKAPFWFGILKAVMLTERGLAAPIDTSCLFAARRVAQEISVPYSFLKEQVSPSSIEILPWDIGIGGEILQFAIPEAAKSWVFTRYVRGGCDFRMGCFQLSFRRFQHKFQTVEEMFDPYKNTRGFAKELMTLRAKYGNWQVALSIYQAQQANVAQWEGVAERTFAFEGYDADQKTSLRIGFGVL